MHVTGRRRLRCGDLCAKSCAGPPTPWVLSACCRTLPARVGAYTPHPGNGPIKHHTGVIVKPRVQRMAR